MTSYLYSDSLRGLTCAATNIGGWVALMGCWNVRREIQLVQLCYGRYYGQIWTAVPIRDDSEGVTERVTGGEVGRFW